MRLQAKLQCSMCPSPFLITAPRRRRHSVILLSMKRCESFCHSVTIAHFSLSSSLIVRKQTLFEDNNAVVWAVNFRSKIDEDHRRRCHWDTEARASSDFGIRRHTMEHASSDFGRPFSTFCHIALTTPSWQWLTTHSLSVDLRSIY